MPQKVAKAKLDLTWVGRRGAKVDPAILKRLVLHWVSSLVDDSVHMWYNPKLKDHFYTTDSLGEQAPWTGYTKIGAYFATFNSRPGLTLPFHRFWSKDNGDHYYAAEEMSLADIQKFEAQEGHYEWEGITGYVFKNKQPFTVPLYRFYLPPGADHFYTTNWAQVKKPPANYKYEGIEAYVWPLAFQPLALITKPPYP